MMETNRWARARFTAFWSSRLAVMSVAWALGACAGTAQAPAHVGTYALESVDGRPMPAEVDSQLMVAAEISLGADGNWTLTARSVAKRPGVRDTTVFRNHGKYTLAGEALTLSSQSAADTLAGKGTLAGATITSAQQGHVMVYRRVAATP